MRKIFRLRNFVLLLILIVGYGVWKYDTFKGYYEFKQLCAKDSGLQVFEKVEKNVGWEAESLGVAEGYQRELNHVAFVRAPNDKGELVDVTYKGVGAWGLDSSYNMPPANLSIPTRYSIKVTAHPEQESRQLWKSVVQVFDLQTKKLSYQWIEYSYKWRDPKKSFGSLLGPSGTVLCPSGGSLPDFDVLNQQTFRETSSAESNITTNFEELKTNIFEG